METLIQAKTNRVTGQCNYLCCVNPANLKENKSGLKNCTVKQHRLFEIFILFSRKSVCLWHLFQAKNQIQNCSLWELWPRGKQSLIPGGVWLALLWNGFASLWGQLRGSADSWDIRLRSRKAVTDRKRQEDGEDVAQLILDWYSELRAVGNISLISKEMWAIQCPS